MVGDFIIKGAELAKGMHHFNNKYSYDEQPVIKQDVLGKPLNKGICSTLKQPNANRFYKGYAEKL